LQILAALPFVRGLFGGSAAAAVTAPFSRVRPGDHQWPSGEAWEELGRRLEGQLIKVASPVSACVGTPSPGAWADVAKELKNPYYLGDEVGLTQTLGWVGAWTSRPSVYAVEAKSTADVVAAVNFARTHKLRLVVKGGGHSYQGTSNAADSLLIWMRPMSAVVLHDAFIGSGCRGQIASRPAVSVGGGAIWGHVYNEVMVKAGRYVQGGGCLTVGVAGLVNGGGFGSLSKAFGVAAGNLLEAEVVTADGDVKIANACVNPDLFWALKGGGSGFGVVTRLTLRTHDLPAVIGGVFATIDAASDDAYERLIAKMVDFYHDALFSPQWGEQIRLQRGRRLWIEMLLSRSRPGAGGSRLAPVLRLGRLLTAGVQRGFAASCWGRHRPQALGPRGSQTRSGSRHGRRPPGRARGQHLLGRKSQRGGLGSARLSVGLAAGVAPRTRSARALRRCAHRRGGTLGGGTSL
jgi:hypothetical protein